MSGGLRVVLTLVWASFLGAVLAGPIGGEDQRLSVEVWLVATSVWLAWSLTRKTLVTVPMAQDELQGLWRWRRAQGPVDAKRPRDLAALEGTMIASRDHERAFAHRLRPRLQRAVDHCLRFDHGIDVTGDSERVSGFLGQSAWLVDETVTDRKPTLAEVDELLKLLEPKPEMEENEATPWRNS